MSSWAIALIGINVTLTIAAIVWNRTLHNRIQKLQQTKEQLEKITLDDVGDIIRHHENKLQQQEHQTQQINTELQRIHERIDGTIQHTSVIRYNPFRDTGGDQSFAAALLDHRGDGLVISSLHSRTGTRVYAKPIEAGTSRFELTEEEMNALARAAEKQPRLEVLESEESTQVETV